MSNSVSISHAASHKALYSASIVDDAMVVCFCDFQEIRPPFRSLSFTMPSKSEGIEPLIDLKSILEVG